MANNARSQSRFAVGYADEQGVPLTGPEDRDMPLIGYQYHDAELLAISIGPRDEAIVTFDLYPIFYPDKPRVALRFGGILNFDSVSKYLEQVREDSHDPDSYLARCDALHLDEKKASKEGDVYVFMELSSYGYIRIHCRHVSETRL